MHRRAAGMALSIVTLVSAPRATFGEGLIQDSHYPIQTCAGDALPPRVERLLKPVLLARAAANRANEEWDTTYESAFYKLLQMKGADARQAQVALMAYYTG